MQLFSTPTVTTLLVDHTERGTQKCLHSKTPNSDFRIYVRKLIKCHGSYAYVDKFEEPSYYTAPKSIYWKILVTHNTSIYER